jgi:hypothetical protein
VTRHAVDIRPQRARRALVEPREVDFVQRPTLQALFFRRPARPSERSRSKWARATVH